MHAHTHKEVILHYFLVRKITETQANVWKEHCPYNDPLKDQQVT